MIQHLDDNDENDYDFDDNDNIKHSSLNWREGLT
jgi:hypothetical protein